MQLSDFLRIVLKLDAASCLGMAALAFPAAAVLQPSLGIEQELMRAAAASLVPIGLFILWLGTRRETAAMLVWLVIVGNLGWVTGSLVAATGLPGITPLGQLVVSVQALAVLALALAEWAGLRSSARRVRELKA